MISESARVQRLIQSTDQTNDSAKITKSIWQITLVARSYCYCQISLAHDHRNNIDIYFYAHDPKNIATLFFTENPLSFFSEYTLLFFDKLFIFNISLYHMQI